MYIYFLLPATGMYTSLFFLAGPVHLHEIAVSAFSRIRLTRTTTFSLLSLRLIARIPLKCFSDFTLFLSASLSLLSILSSTSVLLCLLNFSSLRTSYLLGFPLRPFILSQLCHPTLFQLALFCYSLRYSSIKQLWLATSSFGMFLTCIAFSTFSCLYLSRVGTFSILLLKLYYFVGLSILEFFSCCHLYCFQLFYGVKVRVCSHPSCLRVLHPSTSRLLCLYPKEQPFEISTPRYVYWSTIGNSSSPHFQLKFTGFTLSSLQTTAHFFLYVRRHPLFVSVVPAIFVSAILRVFLISPRSHPQISIPKPCLPPP